MTKAVGVIDIASEKFLVLLRDVQFREEKFGVATQIAFVALGNYLRHRLKSFVRIRDCVRQNG